jgi:hypothetical protein
VRKLADGEIYLLLAGTRSAEGHTQNLHLCATGTRTLRLTALLRTRQGPGFVIASGKRTLVRTF